MSIPDSYGRKLVFIVKKGTDASLFWKGTVQIACIRTIVSSGKIETYRLLNLRQFLRVYKIMIYYTSTAPPSSQVNPVREHVASSTSTSQVSEDETEVKRYDEYASDCCSIWSGSLNTSVILNEITAVTDIATDLDECCICMERKPETTLPCAHSYCIRCIEQWNVSHNTCPLCREKLESTDDSWVISEAPNSEEMQQELQQALLCLAEERPCDSP
ncbi:RING finger protein 141-like isoform X2 [Limulus polyphemus]|nr:RING finger protein 141-like isoform X2 [Limulus polyphemus]